MDLHALSDKIPIRYDFEAPFEEKNIRKGGMEPRSYRTELNYLLYSSSRKDEMTGMGIFGPSVRYYEALGASTTLFQVEVYAINVCARICLNIEGLAGKHVE
jgi:hypothetical protein